MSASTTQRRSVGVRTKCAFLLLSGEAPLAAPAASRARAAGEVLHAVWAPGSKSGRVWRHVTIGRQQQDAVPVRERRRTDASQTASLRARRWERDKGAARRARSHSYSDCCLWVAAGRVVSMFIQLVRLRWALLRRLQQRLPAQTFKAESGAEVLAGGARDASWRAVHADAAVRRWARLLPARRAGRASIAAPHDPGRARLPSSSSPHTQSPLPRPCHEPPPQHLGAHLAVRAARPARSPLLRVPHPRAVAPRPPRPIAPRLRCSRRSCLSASTWIPWPPRISRFASALRAPLAESLQQQRTSAPICGR
jgi:hypothetical protein